MRTLQSELKAKGLLKNEDASKKRKRRKQPSERKREVLSASDLRELMGQNRDTYKRVNGAVRRR